MRRNTTLAILPLALLAACGTPQEQCINRNTSEYRAVSNLLAEVELNLERGYAWKERSVTRFEWDDCPRIVRDRDGNTHLVSSTCRREYVDTERYRVPIDPEPELRKRDNLAKRKAVLAKEARRVVAACKAAYPEEQK